MLHDATLLLHVNTKGFTLCMSGGRLRSNVGKLFARIDDEKRWLRQAFMDKC